MLQGLRLDLNLKAKPVAARILDLQPYRFEENRVLELGQPRGIASCQRGKNLLKHVHRFSYSLIAFQIIMTYPWVCKSILKHL